MNSIIVARSLNHVIGKDNQLPWKCEGDMKHFKKTTLNKVVVMGTNTYKSIGRTLPHRLNVVITRNSNDYLKEQSEGLHGGVLFRDSSFLKNHIFSEVFIIGGMQIYQSALELDLVDTIYLTTIKEEYDGDAYFEFDEEVWNPFILIEETDEYKIELYGRDNLESN